jgi:hypothetical protein
MKIKRVWSIGVFLPSVALLLSAVCAAQRVPPVGAGPAVSYRPLDQLTTILESRYGVAVTYEDPILLWRGDMEAWGQDASRPGTFFPARGTVVVPDELTPQRTPKLTAAALEKALDSLHSLNPDGPHFRLLETRYGFHIVPDTVRDESGRRVSASSILDVSVTVPEAVRMPGEHVVALCRAVGAASGINLDLNGRYTDQYYAFNGFVPRNNMDILGTDEEKRRSSFAWGATAVPARDALISLLGKSATTLSWSLLCSPSVRPEGRTCVLNLAPMVVDVSGPGEMPVFKLLTYDHCVKCPPLPPPPPPRRQQQ